MAAANTDNLLRATANFSATLTSAATTGDTILAFDSLSALPTDTAVVLVLDPGDPTKKEVVIGVRSGNQLISVVRGVEGPATAHASTAIGVDYYTATHHNKMVTAFLAEHDQQGHHVVSPFLVGEIKLWPTTTIPTGWLACDGSAVSRTVYAALFAVISTNYGTGDGASTFLLPSFKGRSPFGYDATQTEFNALGKTGGEKTHLLLTAELPAHNHGVTDPGHAHTFRDPSDFTIRTIIQGGSNGFIQGTSTSATSTSTTGITTQNTGSGTPLNVLNPYQVVNYIIRFQA